MGFGKWEIPVELYRLLYKRWNLCVWKNITFMRVVVDH